MSIDGGRTVRFIDLFAGIGGIRKGFELACLEKGYRAKCVFTSEIKEHAINVLKQNHPDEEVYGDITKVNPVNIPDFDFILAGFPCQAFSAAGKRLGFLDTRGTMFFTVENIIREKQPYGFVLENVEGLVNHDKVDKRKKIGRTLETMLQRLDNLGYKTTWKVLNSKDFGVPQERKRIYITGTKTEAPSYDDFIKTHKRLSDILEKGLPTSKSPFVLNLLSHYSIDELYGKAIKDKRGGKNNIHSWDIELKGKITEDQRDLLNQLLKERRKRKWAEEFGIEWMDGMPLTLEQIKTFYDKPNLKEMLDDLVEKKYVRLEHPKKKIESVRIQDDTLPLGYNIVAGKMSFEVGKILDPTDVAPTLVAMDMEHLFVVDGDGLRRLSLREGLRAFGYPEDFKFDITEKLGFDLLGNTVVVPAIKAVSERLLNVYDKEEIK